MILECESVLALGRFFCGFRPSDADVPEQADFAMSSSGITASPGNGSGSCDRETPGRPGA